jgi:hypothetical protein
VAPYTLRWNVVLTQTRLRLENPVTQTKTITQPDGSVVQSAPITISMVTTMTQAITNPDELAQLPPGSAPEKVIGYQKVISGGHTIISTTTSYTESHLVHIVAYDSAGNKTESERVPIIVIPKKEDEEEDEDGEAYLLPAFDDRRQTAVN